MKLHYQVKLRARPAGSTGPWNDIEFYFDVDKDMPIEEVRQVHDRLLMEKLGTGAVEICDQGLYVCKPTRLEGVTVWKDLIRGMTL